MENFFKLFDIQLSFDINDADLTRRYYSLSRKHHPDNFTLADSSEQISAIEKTSVINEGYKVLKNSDLRMRHILELAGVSFQEGKETVSQEFLMEMMDINEMVMEFQFNPEETVKMGIFSQLQTLEDSMALEIKEIISNFNLTNNDITTLNIIKDYYLKRKYIQRIRSNIQKT